MAISPISNVSFNNYNNVTFESRKNKKYPEYHSHSTSPIKAIPLAALIAMSPLTSVNAQNNINEKVVVSGVFENAKPPTIISDKGEPCEIFFISNDGDDNSVERIKLKFVDKRFKIMDVNGQRKKMNYEYTKDIYADTLVLCNETRKYNGKPDKNTEAYYVLGECRHMRSYYHNSEGDIIKKDGFVKNYKGKIEISKDLYKYLQEIMGDEIQYKVINEEIDGDLETEQLINGSPF